jgi:hypothetical protein
MHEKKAPKEQGKVAQKNRLTALLADWQKLIPHAADSHLEDRTLLLQVAHEFLTRTKAEPIAVLRILRHAKKTAFIQMRKRQGILTGRALQRERDIYAEKSREVLTGLQDRLIGNEPNGLSQDIDTVLEK